MRYLDLEAWPRRQTYEVYRQYDYPHFQLSASIDISEFHSEINRRSISISIAVVYLLARAANQLAEFRLRMRDGQVVEHETVHPSFTVLLEDERLSFCTVTFVPDFASFNQAAAERIQSVKDQPVLHDEPGQDDLLYMTSIPWVSFTGVLHPIHMHPADSVPRITWGRFYEEHGKLRMPLSVQVNHALMDGLHVGRFFQLVESLTQDPNALLS